MARLDFLMIYLWVIFSRLLIPGHGHLSLPEKHAALFIFGDSLFDAGNNKYINNTKSRADFFPYGETFFKHPTGRFSDGRLISDFIAEYAKLPLIPTFLPSTDHEFTFGVNFASGGAGALVETNKGYVIDLSTQLSYFKIVEKKLKQRLGDERTKTLISKAVYLFSIGTNDYLVPVFANSSVLHSEDSRNEYIAMVIGNLTATIQEIYKKGGRKFGFLNLFPLGCIPALKTLVPAGSPGSCLGDASELTKLHNKAFSEVLQEMESQLQGFKYANHDFYNSEMERINNPSKYGFKETKSACCGSGPFRGLPTCGEDISGFKNYELCENPDEYFYFDFVHSTEKANKQFAELMWNGTPDVTGPYNLKTLFEMKSNEVIKTFESI